MTKDTINLNSLNSYAAFEQLRRTAPELYWKGSTQSLLHKKAGALGEKFFEEPQQPRKEDGTYSSITSPPTSSLDRIEKIAGLERALAELKGELEGDNND